MLTYRLAYEKYFITAALYSGLEIRLESLLQCKSRDLFIIHRVRFISMITKKSNSTSLFSTIEISLMSVERTVQEEV